MNVGPMATGVSVYSIRAPLGGISDDDIVSRLLTNSFDLYQSLFPFFICLVNWFNYLGSSPHFWTGRYCREVVRIFGSNVQYIQHQTAVISVGILLYVKILQTAKVKKGWGSNKNYISFRVCLNFFEGICTHLLC